MLWQFQWDYLLPPPTAPRWSYAISPVCLCVIMSVCTASNKPICLKLDVVIGPTGRKNLLTFGDDLIPDHFRWTVLPYVRLMAWAVHLSSVCLKKIKIDQYCQQCPDVRGHDGVINWQLSGWNQWLLVLCVTLFLKQWAIFCLSFTNVD